ncbi:NAD(P)-dependent oxidoreductase [Agromyces bracchium]|uniref:NAD-binding protein n=1 Tax=Agromyces bracchium TaxID=88376 RepID=A0A6I3M7H6_9MICO|nr:NAD(P)-dependent oxidoreductase [Agromyces bracchium]MTH69284.1 NAD-binding protein [Agromyces bracchium]
MTAERPFDRLGFIGLGVMGSGQSANLTRKAELPVTVFDMFPEAVDRLVEAGARAAGSVAEVAAGSDVVFLSLPGGPQVEEVVLGEDGVFANARPGTIVVDLSTVPVAVAQRIGRAADERGLAFIDAPVARTRQAAIDGTLSITAGGDRAVFDRVEPLLRTMATDVTWCGANGAGALIKLVNNMVVFETVVALAEALTLIRRSGLVDPALAWDALGQGSAASFTLENHGRKALLPDVHAEGVFPAAYMRKDLGYALELAEQLDTTLPSATLAHDLLGKAVDGGLGTAYHTAVVRVIEGAV